MNRFVTLPLPLAALLVSIAALPDRDVLLFRPQAFSDCEIDDDNDDDTCVSGFGVVKLWLINIRIVLIAMYATTLALTGILLATAPREHFFKWYDVLVRITLQSIFIVAVGMYFSIQDSYTLYLMFILNVVVPPSHVASFGVGSVLVYNTFQQLQYLNVEMTVTMVTFILVLVVERVYINYWSPVVVQHIIILASFYANPRHVTFV